MEAFLEAILEVLLEILVEILGTVLCDICAKISISLDDGKVKKTIKIIIYSIIYTLTFILLVLAFIYKTSIYIYAAMVYLSLCFAINLLILILQSTDHLRISFVLKLVKQVVHILFPVTILVLALVYRNNASNYLVATCSIAIVFFIVFSVFKIHKMIEKFG